MTNRVATFARECPQSPDPALIHHIGFNTISRVCATAHPRCRWLFLQTANETGSNSKQAKNSTVASCLFEVISAPAPGPSHAMATLGQSSTAAQAAKNFVVEEDAPPFIGLLIRKRYRGALSWFLTHSIQGSSGPASCSFTGASADQ
jgi:hypothetical protein